MAFTQSMMQEDLRTYMEQLARVHPDPFAKTDEATYRAQWENIVNTLPETMEEMEFRRIYGGLVSKLRDEHTSVPLPDRKESSGLVWSVLCKDRRLFLALDDPNRESRAFGEIRSVNGRVPWDFTAQGISLFSGTDTAQQIQYLQEQFPQAVELLCPKGEVSRLEWAIAGKEDVHICPTTELGQEAQEGEAFVWQLLDKSTALMTFRAFEDSHKRFDGFLRSMFQKLNQERVPHLIIDLRGNKGGASQYGDELLRYLLDQPFTQMSESLIHASPEAIQGFLAYVPSWLRWLPWTRIHPTLKKMAKGPQGTRVPVEFKPLSPHSPEKRFLGEVTLLVGPGTMSSASLFAATIQKYRRGRLVGRETGGAATHFGNQITLRLPATGISWMVPCSINMGNSQGPLSPELHVEQSLDDFARGIDTALEKARQRTQ